MKRIVFQTKKLYTTSTYPIPPPEITFQYFPVLKQKYEIEYKAKWNEKELFFFKKNSTYRE